MMKVITRIGLLLILLVLLPGCELVGDIFRAGVWSGILLVVLIIALILYVVSRTGKRK